MKIWELPGNPRIWNDFLESGIPEVPAARTLDDLARHAAAVGERVPRNQDLIRLLPAESLPPRSRENARRLGAPGTFALVANLAPEWAGGPLGQLFKSLTAVKLCEELAQRSISAVPVCWVNCSPLPAHLQCSSVLVDADGKILTFPAASDPAAPEQMGALLSEIRVSGAFDPDAAGIFEAAFASGKALSGAVAQLYCSLLEPWGAVFIDAADPGFRAVEMQTAESIRTKLPGLEIRLDREAEALAARGYPDPGIDNGAIPGVLLQGTMLPVLAWVADAVDVYMLAQAHSAFAQLAQAQPLAVPRISATVGNARIRRTLERYSLELPQLYSGAEELLKEFNAASAGQASERLKMLRSAVKERVAALKAMFEGEADFLNSADAGAGKIDYQLGKLQSRYESALASKQQTARRRITMACNWLAPNGQPQEAALAAVQIPLSFSPAGLELLHNAGEVFKLEHQLIWMD